MSHRNCKNNKKDKKNKIKQKIKQQIITDCMSFVEKSLLVLYKFIFLNRLCDRQIFIYLFIFFVAKVDNIISTTKRPESTNTQRQINWWGNNVSSSYLSTATHYNSI